MESVNSESEELLRPGLPEAADGISNEMALALAQTGVTRFKGFYENAYRLLFAFEDHYEWTGRKRLLTIMPDGTVETDKLLKAGKGKCLLAYGYAQNIAKSKKEALEVQYKDDIDPFIRKCDDDSFSIVQMWPSNYNDTFKQEFREYEQNPSHAKFHLRAVANFEYAVKKLFGDEDKNSKNQKVKYVIRQMQNDKPVYLGRGNQLMQLLEKSPEIFADLGIQKLLDDGFVTTVKVDKKEPTTKFFRMAKELDYALYTKKGHETMACCKPLDQFHYEAMFTLEDKPGTEIPNCLLASPLPQWSYDSRVARLFFNDKQLKSKDCLEIPRPIPIECCVGPAIRWALARVGALWMCVLSTTLLGYLSLSDEDQYLYELYNRWHRVPFVFAALFGLWAEWQCVKLFIVPFVERVLGCAFPLLGLQHFYFWLPAMMISSCVSMFSIQLNAEFMLATIKREHNQAKEIKYWSYLMESSMFGRCHVEWHDINPCFFAGLMWCISTVQLLWPLFEALPLSCKPWRQFDVRYDSATGESGTTWETLPFKLGISSKPMQPYEALLDLAYAGGMGTIGCGAYTYPLGSMRDLMARKDLTWISESVDHLNLAQGQAMKRLFIDGFLKKTLQLKIQVTLYSLDRAVQESETSSVKWMSLIPILITLFTGLASQIDTVFMCLKNHYILRCEVLKEGGGNEKKQLCQQLSSKTYYYSVCIAFLGIVIILGVGYNGLQLWNTHFCSSALWNLRGCVSKEEIEQYKANVSRGPESLAT